MGRIDGSRTVGTVQVGLAGRRSQHHPPHGEGYAPPAGVRVVSSFGNEIYTGRIARGDIVAMRQAPGVLSLKAGKPVTLPSPFEFPDETDVTDAIDEGDEGSRRGRTGLSGSGGHRRGRTRRGRRHLRLGLRLHARELPERRRHDAAAMPVGSARLRRSAGAGAVTTTAGC